MNFQKLLQQQQKKHEEQFRQLISQQKQDRLELLRCIEGERPDNILLLEDSCLLKSPSQLEPCTIQTQMFLSTHKCDSALYIPFWSIIETNYDNASISLVDPFESDAAVEPDTNQRPVQTLQYTKRRQCRRRQTLKALAFRTWHRRHKKGIIYRR